MAKFHGDRPRDLGDYALEKKKHHEHFISLPVTPYGRPKNLYPQKTNFWLRPCRDQVAKLSEITPKFGVLGLPTIWGEGPEIFMIESEFYKPGPPPNMWQAKFGDNRPSDLVLFVSEKKKRQI